MYNKNLNRWKLKKWYEVLLPDYINSSNKIIGQIISHNESNLVNRNIVASIADVLQLNPTQIKDDKVLYSSLVLRTKNIRGTQIDTEVVGYEVALSYLKSLSKSGESGRTIIHHVQKVKLKDGKRVIVKSFLVTPARVSSTVKRNLRKRLETEIENILKNKTFAEFINSLIDETLNAQLRRELNKVNPIQHLIIRKFEYDK